MATLLVMLVIALVLIRLSVLIRQGADSPIADLYQPLAHHTPSLAPSVLPTPTETKAPRPAARATVAPEASPSPEPYRVAVDREVYAVYESALSQVGANDPDVELLPYTGSAPISDLLAQGQADAIIAVWENAWSLPQPENAIALREEPYALIVHPAITRAGFTLKQLADLAMGLDQTYTMVAPEGSERARELLGIDELWTDTVETEDWWTTKEYVATHENTWALVPWDLVDSRVRMLPVDGIELDPHHLGDYPLVRRIWLVTGKQPPADAVEALIEAVGYEPLPTVELVAVGDVMLASYVGNAIASAGALYPFEGEGIHSLLSEADLTFGNLECAISDQGTPQDKTYIFRADPSVVEGLLYAGFDVLSLANNHSGDYGPEALRDTLQRLQTAGIATVGAGENITEAHRSQVFEVNGVRIAFLAYNDVPPNSFEATDTQPGTALMQPERMLGEVRAARDRADVVVVSCHWGQEYTSVASANQRDLATRLSQAGASLVIGHHPHVVQGLQYETNTFIAYSLGNFVFYQGLTPETVGGVVLRCVIDKTGVKIAQLLPYTIVDYQPRLLSQEEGASIIERIQSVTRQQNGFPTSSEPTPAP